MMFGFGILFTRQDNAHIDEDEAEDLDMKLNNLRAPGGPVSAPDGAKEPRPMVELGRPGPEGQGFIFAVGDGGEDENDRLWAEAFKVAWLAQDPDTYSLSVDFYEF